MNIEFRVHEDSKPVWFHQALINMSIYGTIYYSEDVSGEYHRVFNGKLMSYRPDENNREDPKDNDGWVHIVGFNPELYMANESWHLVTMTETIQKEFE